MPDRQITLTEAAGLLRVSTKTVTRWIDRGRLPGRRTNGGHRRVLRADVVALADRLAADRARELKP